MRIWRCDRGGRCADPDSGTTPDEYLAAVREDVGGTTLRRIVGGLSGLTTDPQNDGFTVYRGTIAAAQIVRAVSSGLAGSAASSWAVVRMTRDGELWAAKTLRWNGADVAIVEDTPGRAGRPGAELRVVDGSTTQCPAAAALFDRRSRSRAFL